MSGRPVVIVGAGRHGRNVLELVRRAGHRQVAGFLDDTKEPGSAVLGAPVLGGFGRMEDHGFVAAHAWLIALGNGAIRAELGGRLVEAGAEIDRAIHPLADVSSDAEVAHGVFIAAFAAVRSGCHIGAWALIEGGGHMGCDCRIGEAVSFGPGCLLAGGASVGGLSFLGAGTVVGGNVRIGRNCTIGAQSAVMRDIADGCRAQGVPARVVGEAPYG